eukprot:4277153-Pleurochrysis_carterae.AAC.1
MAKAKARASEQEKEQERARDRERGEVASRSARARASERIGRRGDQRESTPGRPACAASLSRSMSSSR